MAELSQKRGGHRGRITKILPIVDELTKDFKEENRLQVKKYYFELKEKLNTLNKLDEQILDLVSVTKGRDVIKEVEEANKYKEDLFQAIISCEEVLNKQEKAIKEPTPAVMKSVRVKLPKLEAFDGKAYE